MEYTSSIWSPLASSTSITKLQVRQNAALRTATGCTQDTNIQHLQLYVSQIQQYGESYSTKLFDKADEFFQCQNVYIRGASSVPNTDRFRLMVIPGLSIGMTIIDCCLYFCAPVFVLPIKIQILHRGSMAPIEYIITHKWYNEMSPSYKSTILPDVHHLCPLTT